MSPTLTTAVPSPVALDAHYPVALLPVRIETRLAGTQLRVRIFPDEIFADTHEPGLTADEIAGGQAYVQAIKTAGELGQWRSLASRFGAPRAAWIALACAKGSPASRADTWTRAAQAILPDSWIVRAYQGPFTYTQTIPAVRQPLALTVSPNPGTQVPISDQLTVDAELEWTINYGAAVAAGMAVTLDLSKPDELVPANPAGVEPLTTDLVVIGVKNLAPEAGAARLRALLDAQHYTRGIAFVAPGTPTSNSDEGTTAFPPADPSGSQSFAVERQGALAAPNDGSDGDRFARALGLAPVAGEQLAAVEHVAGAARQQDMVAAAMNDALWPATLGYFMEQMMAPKFDDATIAAARQYFAGTVRPGGPLPAFRVGRVPYGLLPVVSLTRYAPDSALAHALRILRDSHFLPASSKMPRVTAGSSDPDGDLLQALAMDASCRELRIRTLLGKDTTGNTAGLFGSVAASLLQQQQAVRAAAASALLSTVGLGADTRLGHLDPGATAELLGGPLIQSAPLSESAGVGYIQTLLGWARADPIDVASIRDDKLPGIERPLLYRVLRHALLVELDRVSVPQLISFKQMTIADRAEPELINLGSTPTRTSYARIMQTAATPALAPQIQPYLKNLDALAALPSAELERRFGETLDACSHRLEAWITSLASARLWSMRATAPLGCHFGAFGWVENVRTAPAGATAGGYIHAPSAAHASTAAILRNGYLSRGGGGSAYAVDLSSARVRDALKLLDGTRQGEPLSALLGYRFERELHDHDADRLIAPLRSQFPLVAGKTPEGAGPVELVAATNVVDGLALRAAGPTSVPGIVLGGDEAKILAGALARLDDAVDGLADLLTAESVFQAVRGNPTAAAASLDSMAWVGTLLGNLSRVGCQVLESDGTARSVTATALALRPLDLIALAKSSASGQGDGELDRRVLHAAGAAPGATVRYDSSDVAHSFAECLELARAIALMLGGARALSPADLVATPDAASAPITSAMAQQAAGRARDALGRMTAIAASLSAALAPVAAKLASAPPAIPAAAERSALRSALRSAALLGVTGAYPAPGAGASDLAALATAAQTELASRRSAVPPLTATDPTALMAAASDTMRAIFGRDFLFLPQLTPPAPSTLTSALLESPSLIADANLPRQVLQQMARVRPALGRWRAVFLYAEAHRPTQPPATRSWAGLVVDEWTELIPAATQPTELAFRYENPVAEAPQAVLLAVPPVTAAATWDMETLLATVRETLALAKVRLVDTVDDLRPFLPAICLTGNTANETVSTNFLESLIADPAIVKSA